MSVQQLDAREKERCRYHLGYLQVQPAAAITFGIPTPMQTLFLVESAMNRVLAESVGRIRQILKIMDDIECKLVAAQDRLAATRLDGISLRDGEPDLLEKEYCRWGYRLANVLGCPVYPFSERYRNGGGTVAGSVPVR